MIERDGLAEAIHEAIDGGDWSTSRIWSRKLAAAVRAWMRERIITEMRGHWRRCPCGVSRIRERHCDCTLTYNEMFEYLGLTEPGKEDRT